MNVPGNNKGFQNKTVAQIDRMLAGMSGSVELTGGDLTVSQIIAVARNKSLVEFTKDKKVIDRIKHCYGQMMKDIADGIPIYGCNTGYGARASRVLNNGTEEERFAIASAISEGISHIDISVGPRFDADVIRAAMVIRLNMLMGGVSAVKLEDLGIYRLMLNHGITPIVNQYGGIGASGDLAHNCRILSAARQLEGVKVLGLDGQIKDAKDALSEVNIPKLILDPKAGLGFVNGDNFSTGLAALLAYDTFCLLLLAQVAGAMMVEVLRGTNRSFHPMLGEVRPHPGQKEVAALYRYLLEGSKLAYQEMKGHGTRQQGIKIQDGYSLRGISQYHGVNVEKIKQIFEVITINANSISDNPLWVSPEYATDGEKPWQWVSGGNFLSMYMVEAMDGLRKIMTQVVKLNDRHLARLVDPSQNNGLPANLSDKKAITQCTFKGVQIQSGMFEVYAQLLSIPVSTFFGLHEEGNQDITSHALTSGILGLDNLRIARYSLAQNLLAIAQAVDLLGGPNNLSSRTRPVYQLIRSKTEYIEKERPLSNDIELIFESVINGELMQVVRSKVLMDFEL